MSIARKIFLSFCLVVLVVLGLGLWSLHSTQRLHELNRTLVMRAIPAVHLQLALAQQVPSLVRHETRAIILKDPAYEVLHREGLQMFERRVTALAGLLEGREAHDVLGHLRARFAEYRTLVEEEWAATDRKSRDRAVRLSQGPTRAAADGLAAAIDEMLAQSLAELDRKVTVAGGLERAVRTVAILGLTLTLVIGLSLAGTVAMRIGRPIRALSRSTQLIAHGQYDVPISATGSDEVGELARAFRGMAGKLCELERLKQEFFHSIAHELRSPLTSINMAASLMEAGPLTPKQERWLEVIRLDSEKLLRLTNQILDLGKLRSGHLPLNVRPTDLRMIAERARDEVQPLIAEKGIRLTIDLSDQSSVIVCDTDRMEQVLANLLANAVRFTPKAGRISVTSRTEAEELIVTVEDTGIGIPAAELPHIFERYHQAHRGAGGTGLGLAIVKSVVEAHGGRLWVESREGEGSRFHVALPRDGGQP